MFDFEYLDVYQKALNSNKKIFQFLKNHSEIDYFLQDQLKRASVSIVLNIAEGVGRFTKPDKSHFYIISRGSAFEVVAVLKIIVNQYSIDPNVLHCLRADLNEIVKMLFGLIKNVSPKPLL